MGLPRIPIKDRIRQQQSLSFGGINRNPAAADGTVFWTSNMGSDRAPLLAPRKPRYHIGRYSNCNGITAYNGLYMILENTVYKDGEALGQLENSNAHRQFAQMNGQIIVFPDKAILHAEAVPVIDPEAVHWPSEDLIVDNAAVEFFDNAIMDIDTRDPVDWRTLVRVGDLVSVLGGTVAANNKRARVRAVSETEITFDAGTFTPASMQRITLTRALVEPVIEQVGFVEPMNIAVEGVLVRFQDGTYGGEFARGNTIWAESFVWEQTRLRVGDAVTISGSSEPGNNQTIIIREMDGQALRFYEESFTPTGQERIFIQRAVPDMDGIFTHENRLWGWKGNTIYASKLGDPLNFDVFDGLSTDSWRVEMDGPGDIIGAIVYQGYPTFFKEERVYRVYGDRPSQYRVMEVSAMGVHPECGESLAIAGDTLFYVSRNGVTAFSGGYSRDAHQTFGELRIRQARAASDGRRYYLAANYGDTGDTWALFVYDTVWDVWFREDWPEIKYFALDRGGLFALNAQGLLWLDGHATRIPQGAVREGPIESECVFNDFTGANWQAGRSTGNPNRKGTSKLLLRVTMDEGATLKVMMTFDGEESQPLTVKELTGRGRKQSFYLPIIPRRSDHYRIILLGTGDWTLDSLTREEYAGSPLRGR